MPPLTAWPLLVTLLAGQLSPPPRDTAEAAVIGLEQAWSRAFMANDVATIDRILAAEFVGIDGRGVVSRKADELEEARKQNPATGIEREELDAFAAQVYGSTVVLRARNRLRMHVGADVRAFQYWRTTVWVERDGRYQCVAFHASRILVD